MRSVLTNATLIDCVNPNPVAEASVVIEEGRIAEITSGNRSPSKGDAHVVDLDGAYLLPGLWDVHIHPDYATDPNITVAQQTARFGQNLMRGMSEAGVVGVRCGGAGHFMDVGRGATPSIRANWTGRESSPAETSSPRPGDTS